MPHGTQYLKIHGIGRIHVCIKNHYHNDACFNTGKQGAESEHPLWDSFFLYQGDWA